MKEISETVSKRLDDSSRRLALFQEGKTREEVLQLMGPRDTSVPIDALRERIKLEIDSTRRSLNELQLQNIN